MSSKKAKMPSSQKSTPSPSKWRRKGDQVKKEEPDRVKKEEPQSKKVEKPESEARFEIGDVAKIHGLKSAAADWLNGETGKIIGFDE